MYRTDEPIFDFNRKDAEECDFMAKLPVCDCCNEPITDEHYYEIDGSIMCQECLDYHCKKCVDDYIS